jgi:hypothetical protein
MRDTRSERSATRRRSEPDRGRRSDVAGSAREVDVAPRRSVRQGARRAHRAPSRSSCRIDRGALGDQPACVEPVDRGATGEIVEKDGAMRAACATNRADLAHLVALDGRVFHHRHVRRDRRTTGLQERRFAVVEPDEVDPFRNRRLAPEALGERRPRSPSGDTGASGGSADPADPCRGCARATAPGQVRDAADRVASVDEPLDQRQSTHVVRPVESCPESERTGATTL